jgi:hypothetical protein
MSPSELQLARAVSHNHRFSIRTATVEDEHVLERLAGLDSSRPPSGTVLIGAIDDEPAAAIGLADGHVVADPFRRTAELVTLLRARRDQLSSVSAGRSPKRLASGALAPSTLRGTGGPYGC